MNNELDRFSEGESKWNSAEQTLKRIHQIQLILDMYRENNTWDTLASSRETLDSLQMELVGYMNAAELKEVELLRVKVLPSYYSTKRLGKIPPPFLREKLRVWETALRRIIVKKGMGLVAKDTDSVFILPGGRK
jgi:hypothetical protein